jgi:hypothetical protein
MISIFLLKAVLCLQIQGVFQVFHKLQEKTHCHESMLGIISAKQLTMVRLWAKV